jgi:hypothetical protein
MAEGVVSNLIELAATGRQQMQSPAPMRDSETFQFELGRVVADLRAARAFFRAQSASHWHHAVAGTLKGEALLAESTQAAIWTTATCIPSLMPVSPWLAAARCTRAHPCSGACATCMLPGSTLGSSNDTT